MIIFIISYSEIKPYFGNSFEKFSRDFFYTVVILPTQDGKEAKGFIQKPFTISELSKKIRKVLDEGKGFIHNLNLLISLSLTSKIHRYDIKSSLNRCPKYWGMIKIGYVKFRPFAILNIRTEGRPFYTILLYFRIKDSRTTA